MSGATIHTSLISAFRQRLLQTIKATTGAVATLSAAGNVFSRSSGSFVADGFGIGDEVMPAGFDNAANNARNRIKSVTPTTLTVESALVTEAAGGSRAIVAGIPQGRDFEDGKKYTPQLGVPFITDNYNILASTPVGVGTGGAEGHSIQAIFGLRYPNDTGPLAVRMMAGAIRHQFRPGVWLSYGGDSGILLASSVSGRLVEQPDWLIATVTATVSARTTG